MILSLLINGPFRPNQGINVPLFLFEKLAKKTSKDVKMGRN